MSSSCYWSSVRVTVRPSSWEMLKRMSAGVARSIAPPSHDQRTEEDTVSSPSHHAGSGTDEAHWDKVGHRLPLLLERAEIGMESSPFDLSPPSSSNVVPPARGVLSRDARRRIAAASLAESPAHLEYLLPVDPALAPEKGTASSPYRSHYSEAWVRLTGPLPVLGPPLSRTPPDICPPVAPFPSSLAGGEMQTGTASTLSPTSYGGPVSEYVQARGGRLVVVERGRSGCAWMILPPGCAQVVASPGHVC